MTDLEKLRAGLERVAEFQHGPLSIPLYDVGATNTLMRQAADEIEALRKSTPRFTWSSELPTAPGLYWAGYIGQRRQIVEIIGEPGRLMQMFYGEPTALERLPKDWEWQWAGPIPEPKEP